MNKAFYQSLTFWGVVAWAIVGVLEQAAVLNPEVSIYAQSIAAILTVLGIRRAIPSP